MAVTEGLMMFGNRELFVINTKNSGLISMNALPPAFKCLKEWDNEKGYLTDNCLTAQDKYKGIWIISGLHINMLSFFFGRLFSPVSSQHFHKTESDPAGGGTGCTQT